MKKKYLTIYTIGILVLFSSCEWPRHVLLNNKRKQEYRIDNNCTMEIATDIYSATSTRIWIKPKGCDIYIIDVEKWLKQIADQNNAMFDVVGIGRAKNAITNNALTLKKNHWLTINVFLYEYLESENTKLVFPKSEYVLYRHVPVFKDTISFFLEPGKMKFIFGS